MLLRLLQGFFIQEVRQQAQLQKFLGYPMD
jgi:hypothetical protein